MSSYDTLRVESQNASAVTHAPIIAQKSDLLLQACGLGPEPRPEQLSQSVPPITRGRGRPQRVCWTQLWSNLLLCALQGMHSFADWRRLVGLEQIGPFAPVWLTRNGLVKRLLQGGLEPFQELWELIMHHCHDLLLFMIHHLRWQFLYHPKYAAYLNLIEHWWKVLRSLTLKGRRFETWREVEAAVKAATAYWNARKHPFVWGRRRRHQPPRCYRKFSFQVKVLRV